MVCGGERGVRSVVARTKISYDSEPEQKPDRTFPRRSSGARHWRRDRDTSGIHARSTATDRHKAPWPARARGPCARHDIIAPAGSSRSCTNNKHCQLARRQAHRIGRPSGRSARPDCVICIGRHVTAICVSVGRCVCVGVSLSLTHCRLARARWAPWSCDTPCAGGVHGPAAALSSTAGAEQTLGPATGRTRRLPAGADTAAAPFVNTVSTCCHIVIRQINGPTDTLVFSVLLTATHQPRSPRGDLTDLEAYYKPIAVGSVSGIINAD